MWLLHSEPLKGFPVHSERKSEALNPCTSPRSSGPPFQLCHSFSTSSPARSLQPPWPPGCSQTRNLLPQGLCLCLEPSPYLQSPSPMTLTLTSFKSFLKSHLLKEVFLWPSYLKLQPSPSPHFHALTTLHLFILTYYVSLLIYFAYYLSSSPGYKLHESREFCLFKFTTTSSA